MRLNNGTEMPLLNGVAVIPKSSRREMILENSDVYDFAVGPTDMKALDSLSEGYHTGWDSTDEP